MERIKAKEKLDDQESIPEQLANSIKSIWGLVLRYFKKKEAEKPSREEVRTKIEELERELSAHPQYKGVSFDRRYLERLLGKKPWEEIKEYEDITYTEDSDRIIRVTPEGKQLDTTIKAVERKKQEHINKVREWLGRNTISIETLERDGYINSYLRDVNNTLASLKALQGDSNNPILREIISMLQRKNDFAQLLTSSDRLRDHCLDEAISRTIDRDIRGEIAEENELELQRTVLDVMRATVSEIITKKGQISEKSLVDELTEKIKQHEELYQSYNDAETKTKEELDRLFDEIVKLYHALPEGDVKTQLRRELEEKVYTFLIEKDILIRDERSGGRRFSSAESRDSLFSEKQEELNKLVERRKSIYLNRQAENLFLRFQGQRAALREIDRLLRENENNIDGFIENLEELLREEKANPELSLREIQEQGQLEETLESVMIKKSTDIKRGRSYRRRGYDRIIIRPRIEVPEVDELEDLSEPPTPEPPTPEPVPPRLVEDLDRVWDGYLAICEKYLLAKKDRRRLWSGVDQEKLAEFRDMLLESQRNYVYLNMVLYYLNNRERYKRGELTYDNLINGLVEAGIRTYDRTWEEYFRIEREIEGNNTASRFQNFWRSRRGNLLRLVGGGLLAGTGVFTGIAPLASIGAAMATDALGWTMAVYAGRNRERRSRDIERMSPQRVRDLISSHLTLAREKGLNLFDERDRQEYEHRQTFEMLMAQWQNGLAQRFFEGEGPHRTAIEMTPNDLISTFADFLRNESLSYLTSFEEADIRARRYRIGRKFTAVLAGLAAGVATSLLHQPTGLEGGVERVTNVEELISREGEIKMMEIDKNGIPHFVIKEGGKYFWFDGKEWRPLLGYGPDIPHISSQGFSRSVIEKFLPFMFKR